MSGVMTVFAIMSSLLQKTMSMMQPSALIRITFNWYIIGATTGSIRNFGEETRQVYLVYGSPLSGKTSWVWDAKTEGDLIVDMDSIWQCISGCECYVKPGALNSCAFGVRDYLIDCIKYRRGKWRNAYLVGGYPLISERERLCRELRAREVFIDTPKEECIRRLSLCTDNRDKIEWQKFIDDWWKRYSPVLSHVKARGVLSGGRYFSQKTEK